MSMFVKQVCERKVIEHSCSAMQLKKSLVRFPHCAMTHELLYLPHFRLAYRHRTLVGRMIRSSTLLVNKRLITLNIKIDSPGSRWSIWLYCQTKQYPQVMSPTSSYFKVTQIWFPFRTARMNIQWQLKIFTSDKLHLLQCLKILCSSDGWVDPGAVQRAVQKRRARVRSSSTTASFTLRSSILRSSSQG